MYLSEKFNDIHTNSILNFEGKISYTQRVDYNRAKSSVMWCVSKWLDYTFE